MVRAVSEQTAGAALPRLRNIMLSTEEGRRVLKDRPYVSSKTVDVIYLSKLPEHTFGRAFITFLDRCGITPDQTDPVGPLLLIRFCKNTNDTLRSSLNNIVYRDKGVIYS